MATNIVSIDNSKKHRTKDEIARRKKAEKQLERENIALEAPPYIQDDAAAFAYWQNTVERMKDISLLDDVDTDMLAVYCDLQARRDKLRKMAVKKTTINDDALKRLEATEKLILSYAEKLGMTPAARARLAKKRAEEEEDPNGHLFS